MSVHSSFDDGVFTAWPAHQAAVWGSEPVKTGHRLHESPLLALGALAELIDAYPRQHYSLIHMGARGERRFWREGDLGGLKGKDVIEWIANGRMWLNLRRVDEVDSRYAELLHLAYDAIAANAPGPAMTNTSMGILISSPNAQVYYHCDLPGQALWQIHGRKRILIYPNREPFLQPRSLEDIALFGVEVDLPYETWFDDFAQTFELEPGDMAHWPLNAPHRVENGDMLNVSITSEHWSDEITRLHRVNVANGLLRHRLGWTPRSRAISGPGYWAKAALQSALRRSSWVAKQRAGRRAVDFKLDPDRRGGVLDIAQVAS
jgi:hypothetical protein